MSFKQNLETGVEWGKKNPLIVIGLFLVLVYVFFARQREEAPATGVVGDTGIGQRVTGQAFPQPFPTETREGRRDVVTMPSLLPETLWQERPARTEVIVTQVAAQQEPALIPGWRPRLDYDILGSQVYQEALAKKHTAMVPGVPDRPVANGLIKTVAHGWQTPQEIMARQKVRFDRAYQAGRMDIAEKVRRETELAIGQRVGW